MPFFIRQGVFEIIKIKSNEPIVFYDQRSEGCLHSKGKGIWGTGPWRLREGRPCRNSPGGSKACSEREAATPFLPAQLARSLGDSQLVQG